MNRFLAGVQTLREALQGYKTHLLLGLGIVAVLGNRFGPEFLAVAGLDPVRWKLDVWLLLTGHAAKAGMNRK